LVGLLGALGGVLLPIAWSTIPGSTFAALLALTVVSAAWFAVSTVRVRKPAPALALVEVREPGVDTPGYEQPPLRN
jgi:uncharacterized membrane protein